MDDIRISFAKFTKNTNAISPEAGIKLIVNSISGHQINMQYETITGNCPLSFGNKIHIWKGDGVKWGTKPYLTQDMPNDDQDGQFFIDGLNIGKNSFTIGYSVGASPEQTAASVIIPTAAQGPEDYEYSAAEIMMTAVNDTSVSFSYRTLDGYTPKDHRAWVGIWERKRVPYPGNDPIGLEEIPYNSDNGNGMISQIEIASGQEYCMGLFLPSEKETDRKTYLAASCTFQY